MYRENIYARKNRTINISGSRPQELEYGFERFNGTYRVSPQVNSVVKLFGKTARANLKTLKISGLHAVPSEVLELIVRHNVTLANANLTDLVSHQEEDDWQKFCSNLRELVVKFELHLKKLDFHGVFEYKTEPGPAPTTLDKQMCGTSKNGEDHGPGFHIANYVMNGNC